MWPWKSAYNGIISSPGIRNLQDWMPDDLRWSWHNNNRNKVHNKYNMLKSSPSLVRRKTVFHETSSWCQKCWGLLIILGKIMFNCKHYIQKICISSCFQILKEYSYFQDILTNQFTLGNKIILEGRKAYNVRRNCE